MIHCDTWSQLMIHCDTWLQLMIHCDTWSQLMAHCDTWSQLWHMVTINDPLWHMVTINDLLWHMVTIIRKTNRIVFCVSGIPHVHITCTYDCCGFKKQLNGECGLLSGRVLDSRSKGCGFKSLQEQWENFQLPFCFFSTLYRFGTKLYQVWNKWDKV